MTYRASLALLEERRRLGMQPGLERIKEALRLLGDPQKHLRVVHVAGTNGKGSTAAMIAACAAACGYRTGLFSSPPVAGYRETVQIDGTPESEETFAALIGRVAALPVPLTEYECLTAAALLCFYEQRTDLCVVECCMGGLLDTTNVFDTPLVAVLTPVALDHTGFLGDTVEAIAAQKCGIIKPDCDVVTSPAQSPEALGVIMASAAEKGAVLYQPNAAAYPLVDDGPFTAFRCGDEVCRLSLIGTFQRDNAVTALQVLDCLGKKGFTFDRQAVLKALSCVTMPCRQELLRPHLLIDAAHNPHGIAALAATLRHNFADREITAVWGMLRDKDVAACVALIAPLCRRVYCCAPQSPRALPAAQLKSVVSSCGVEAVAFDNAVEALAAAEKTGDFVLIGGSFYHAGPLRAYLTK